MKVTVRFNEDDLKLLQALDKEFNPLGSNFSTVIRHAVKKLHHDLKVKGAKL